MKWIHPEPFARRILRRLRENLVEHQQGLREGAKSYANLGNYKAAFDRHIEAEHGMLTALEQLDTLDEQLANKIARRRQKRKGQR